MYEVGDKVVHRVYKEWGTCTIHGVFQAEVEIDGETTVKTTYSIQVGEGYTLLFGVEDKHIHPPGEESDLVVTKKGLKKRNKQKKED
jgi:hypothetical protein